MNTDPLTRRVLIADDTDDIRELLSIVLMGARMTVVGAAKDGDEAIELWRRQRPPDLHAIVLDQRMPGRTGLEVAREILAEQPDQRIVLFSGQVDDRLRAEAAEIGITAVVQKDELMALPHHRALA